MVRISEIGKRIPLPQNRFSWVLAGVGATGLAMVTAGFFLTQQPEPELPPTTTTRPPAPTTINALGRLEPNGEVLQISAPSNFGENNRVVELLVEEGDQVRAGQAIAILDNRKRLQSAFKEAQKQVQVAKAQLAQVLAGSPQGDIAAQQAIVTRLKAELEGETRTQQATIARLEAELKNAQTEYRRYQALYQDGAVAASTLDSRELAVRTAQEQLNEALENYRQTAQTLKAQIREAESTLDRVAEVRPTDIAAGQAEVERAIATVERTQAELELTYIHAPRSGQILEIHTRPGETVGENGIAELGQTNRMFVIAEVYETDINKVQVGQTAKIASPTLARELQGIVDKIGLQVRRQDVLDTNPTTNTDARVIEVRIRLNPEASQKVSGLTNQQVRVSIQL